MSTLFVNLFSGPGAGKSTLASDIFTKLKKRNVTVEYVTEFAKDLTWKQDWQTLRDQLFVSATQRQRSLFLDGRVKVCVTDSPFILGCLYYSQEDMVEYNLFEDYMIHLFKKQNNLNFILTRQYEYDPVGRNQTEEEAKELDRKIRGILYRHQIPYIMTKPKASKVVKLIMEHISDD